MASLRQRFGESAGAFAAVARSRGLRRLALAFTGSELGGWAYSIALSVLAFEAGGAALLGLTAFVLMAAPAAASPFMALLGDRFDRVRVMAASDAVRLVLMGVAAAAAALDAPFGVLLVVAALSAVASTAFRPAQAAILPSLARSPAELTAANVVTSTVESVTSFVGPALAGAILALTAPAVAFTLAAATFLWSALLVAGVRVGPSPREDGAEPVERERVWAALATGARAVVEPRVRLLIGMMGAQTIVAGTLIVFAPVVALDRLAVGEQGLGWLYSALGIGGVIGVVGAAALVGRGRLAPAFAVGTLLWGAPLALLAVSESYAGALILLGVVGFANTVVDVSGYTLLQRAVPEPVLARVFGILESVIYGTIALGGLAASALIELFGLRTALVVAGALLPVLVALTWRNLQTVDVDSPAPERELELLRGVPFLASLPAATLEGLAARLERVTVPAGTTVISKGEAGDRFYVVSEGEATVQAAGEPRASLAPGDGFGEIALVRDVPRTATVTAATDLALYALERDDFLAALTGHAPSHQAAWAVVEARLAPRAP